MQLLLSLDACVVVAAVAAAVDVVAGVGIWSSSVQATSVNKGGLPRVGDEGGGEEC
jgi:hypothetical protein